MEVKFLKSSYVMALEQSFSENDVALIEDVGLAERLIASGNVLEIKKEKPATKKAKPVAKKAKKTVAKDAE